MTLRQIVITAIVGTFVLIAGCNQCFVLGESRPPTKEGQVLQIELHAYVQSFVKRVGLTPDKLQWAVLVLPIMEMPSPAVTYGWALPPPHTGLPVELWMAIFTFEQDWMLAFSPAQRRVITAHEVGHMEETCVAIQEPDMEGMDRYEKMMANFNFQVLNESCADIVSAQLTNPEGVLDLLHELLNRYSHNPVIIHRMRIIREYADKIREAPLP